MIQLHPTAQFLPEGGKVAAARLAGQRIQYLMVTHLWEVDGCELARRVKRPLG